MPVMVSAVPTLNPTDPYAYPFAGLGSVGYKLLRPEMGSLGSMIDGTAGEAASRLSSKMDELKSMAERALKRAAELYAKLRVATAERNAATNAASRQAAESQRQLVTSTLKRANAAAKISYARLLRMKTAYVQVVIARELADAGKPEEASAVFGKAKQTLGTSIPMPETMRDAEGWDDALGTVDPTRQAQAAIYADVPRSDVSTAMKYLTRANEAGQHGGAVARADAIFRATRANSLPPEATEALNRVRDQVAGVVRDASPSNLSAVTVEMNGLGEDDEEDGAEEDSSLNPLDVIKTAASAVAAAIPVAAAAVQVAQGNQNAVGNVITNATGKNTPADAKTLAAARAAAGTIKATMPGKLSLSSLTPVLVGLAAAGAVAFFLLRK